VSEPGHHGDDTLLELAAGTLEAPARAAAAAHLSGCARCRAEAGVVATALEPMARTLPAELPRPGARARLLDAAGAGGRLHAFAAEVARLMDVAVAHARELLDAIDRPASWTAGPTPAIALFHLQPGPAVAGALVGFVRVAAGERFPWHRHLGDEQVLVLQGAIREEDGRVFRAGQLAAAPGGSGHAFTALPEVDLVYLVVLQGGVEIPGYPSDV
jgi:putative transcriptional regulator